MANPDMRDARGTRSGLEVPAYDQDAHVTNLGLSEFWMCNKETIKDSRLPWLPAPLPSSSSAQSSPMIRRVDLQARNGRG